LLTHRQTDKQTNRQTKSGKNITSLAEVIIVTHLRFDDVRLAHVSDAEEKVELPVTWTDYGALAEHQSLRSLLRSRQLGKDETGHERLRDDAEARLKHDQRYGVRTVRVHAAIAVADRLLSLDREQQRRREVVHLQQYASITRYRTNTKVNSAFHPSRVGKSSTGLSGWG